MQIIIHSKNLDITPAIREYVEIKIGSLKRFLKRFETKSEIIAEIEMVRTTKHHKRGDVFYAEANLHMPKKILRAEHYDSDIRIAIDEIKNKLHKEITKYKEVAIDFRPVKEK
jgi:putative sigma-54 modulation protein